MRTMERSARRSSAAGAIAIGLLALAACGSTPRTGTWGTVAARPSDGRGWLDPAPARTTGGGAASGAATTGAASTSSRAGAPAADASESSSGAAAPAPPRAAGPLQAGNVDDNARFDDYLAYRARVKALGIPFRELDPTGRIVLKVTGSDGLPAAGRAVAITQGKAAVTTLTTTADGSVRLCPAGTRAIRRRRTWRRSRARRSR